MGSDRLREHLLHGPKHNPTMSIVRYELGPCFKFDPDTESGSNFKYKFITSQLFELF